MNPYAQYLPLVLGALGFALQWVRQYRSIHDMWIGISAFALANAGYWLCYDYKHLPEFQMLLIAWLLAIGGHTLTVIGGTFTAARLAPNTNLIPSTSSK
jgi:hypothetical protein